MKIRTVAWLVGVVVLAVGVLAAHYTVGDPEAWRHHTEWARAHGMPEPSFDLFVLGAAMTAVGGAWIGYLFGRGRRSG